MNYWQDLLTKICAGETDGEPPPGIATTRLTVLPEDNMTWETGVVRRRWAMGPWALNHDGTAFGGLLAALADQMTSLAAFSILEDNEASRTASLQVDYFRPAIGPYVEVEARVVNRSRRLIHTETEIKRHDGKAAVHARAVLAIVPFERGTETGRS
jgi:uncharacterized protein (TIGR00369 family)